MKKKIWICAMCLSATMVGMTGCTRVGNKSWSDMTTRERERAESELREIRVELEEAFSEDSAESRLVNVILNRVTEHLSE